MIEILYSMPVTLALRAGQSERWAAIEGSPVSYLQIEIERLRHFLRPWHTGRGPATWESDASDRSAELKRNIIAVAADTVAAGKLAIKGDSFSVPVFDESDYEALEESLTEDQEREKFLALAQACQLALHELRRFMP